MSPLRSHSRLSEHVLSKCLPTSARFLEISFPAIALRHKLQDRAAMAAADRVGERARGWQRARPTLAASHGGPLIGGRGTSHKRRERSTFVRTGRWRFYRLPKLFILAIMFLRLFRKIRQDFSPWNMDWSFAMCDWSHYLKWLFAILGGGIARAKTEHTRSNLFSHDQKIF